MATNYTGDPEVYPEHVQLVDDGDQCNAMSVTVPFSQLANRTAHTKAALDTAVSDIETTLGHLVPVRQTFLSSGTWTRPAGAIWVTWIIVGGGGSGGSNGSAVRGGGGGGSGEVVTYSGYASAMPSSVAITLGSGGTGPGGYGGATTAAGIARANGGSPGLSGDDGGSGGDHGGHLGIGTGGGSSTTYGMPGAYTQFGFAGGGGGLYPYDGAPGAGERGGLEGALGVPQSPSSGAGYGAGGRGYGVTAGGGGSGYGNVPPSSNSYNGYGGCVVVCAWVNPASV